MKVFSVAYRIRSFCLLSEDLQHSGSNSSVTQRASVSRAEHEIDSDGSSRKHGDDDSDSNSDNHTSEHDDGDSDGDGDVVHNSDLGEAQMNTCGMYKNRDLCLCLLCCHFSTNSQSTTGIVLHTFSVNVYCSPVTTFADVSLSLHIVLLKEMPKGTVITVIVSATCLSHVIR